MKSLLIVLVVVALVLLVLGLVVEALKFLFYLGLAVLVGGAVLLVLQRVRSGSGER